MKTEEIKIEEIKMFNNQLRVWKIIYLVVLAMIITGLWRDFMYDTKALNKKLENIETNQNLIMQHQIEMFKKIEDLNIVTGESFVMPGIATLTPFNGGWISNSQSIDCEKEAE